MDTKAYGTMSDPEYRAHEMGTLNAILGKVTTIMEKEEAEENEMAGSLGASDAGVLALLADTSRAGRGYGWGGEGGYGGAPFAGFASNAVRLDRNAQSVEDQADCTRGIMNSNFRSIESAFENQTRNSQFSALSSAITNSEFRNGDRLRDLEREINANAREAAKCCCDVKQEIAQVEARLNSKLDAITIDRLKDDLAQCRESNSTNAILAAIGQNGCRFPGGGQGNS